MQMRQQHGRGHPWIGLRPYFMQLAVIWSGHKGLLALKISAGTQAGRLVRRATDHNSIRRCYVTLFYIVLLKCVLKYASQMRRTCGFPLGDIKCKRPTKTGPVFTIEQDLWSICLERSGIIIVAHWSSTLFKLIIFSTPLHMIDIVWCTPCLRSHELPCGVSSFGDENFWLPLAIWPRIPIPLQVL